MPSDATAVGSRMLLRAAVILVVVVLKSGCPSTTVACPTQTGHLLLYGRSAVGEGSMPERFWNSSTRLFAGSAPRRLSSATISMLAAYATPLAPPIMVLLELGSAVVKVCC